MRLSYSFDIGTPTRQRIFESIIINNGVGNEDGNLYLDTPLDKLYESVLQFAGCAQKVCNMRYWSRENVRSAFYDDLGSYVDQELVQFNPVQEPLPDGGLPDQRGLVPDAQSSGLLFVRSVGQRESEECGDSFIGVSEGATSIHQFGGSRIDGGTRVGVSSCI